MTFQDAVTQVARFNTMAAANSFAHASIKSQSIILGDCGIYWVCSHRIASILIAAGYSRAN